MLRIGGAYLLLAVLVYPASCDEPAPAVSPFSPEQAQTHQRAWAEHLGLPVKVTNSVGMKLVLIPPGQFVMGSPSGEEGRHDAEAQHAVKLTKAFYMGAAEVTQGQWKALMGKNPSFFTDKTLPVDTVSWKEAVEFCRKLSDKEKDVAYRLPTEAEWEYACRAGTITPFYTGATIGTAQANYHGGYTYGNGRKGEYRETSTAAETFTPNAWGLHDMHGNVWEWCADWFGDYPSVEATDPTGPREGQKRVVRGGCWINFPAVCRSANRGSTVPLSWNFNFGFRVVRVLD
jgi:formylglycine-generating enzyme required for sulfatase activity